MRKLFPLAAFLTLALSACGTTNTPPVVTATAPSVVQRSQVAVTGTATDSDGTIATVTVQTSSGTSQATLSGDTYSAIVSLKAGENTVTITASDNKGATNTTTTKVYLGRQVGAGGAHSGALKNGVFYGWGRNNFGQTGFGKTTTIKDNTDHPIVPTKMTTPVPFVSLAFSQNQSSALAAGGALYTWGDDGNGQLGRGDTGRAGCGTLTTSTGSVPNTNNCRLDMGKVEGLPAIAQVSMGYDHTLALAEDGTVWAFGLNSSGQLGNGTNVNSSTPVQVKWGATAPGKVVQVLASAASSYALDDKGQVWGWGRNMYGNLGQGTVSDSKTVTSTPILVPMPAGVSITEIAAGRDHVLALTTEGKVYAWGLNATSQVGYNGAKFKGTADAWPGNVTSPRLLPTTENMKATNVYANGNTSYLRLADGSLRAWGMYGVTEGASSGTTYSNLDEPSDQVPTLKNITDLATGGLHQVAFRNDGQLFTWGWSFEGSLGGGATTNNAWMYNTPLSLTLP